MTTVEPVDVLAALLRELPPLGPWVEEASCGDLGLHATEIFTSDHPDADELALAEATCWRCPVRRQCADYAAQTPVYGLWGASWHTGNASRARAA
jgi:hypothetical protein